MLTAAVAFVPHGPATALAALAVARAVHAQRRWARARATTPRHTTATPRPRTLAATPPRAAATPPRAAATASPAAATPLAVATPPCAVATGLLAARPFGPGRRLQATCAAASLCAAVVAVSVEGRRPRTWISITPQGRAALAAEIAALREIVAAADARPAPKLAM